MAKRLLLNVLVKVLGEYIELNEENLNLGVWSGQIVLNNLKLKTDKFLRNLNVVINHGSIKSLEIKIPWATLLQNPIKIRISGVYLDVGPLDLSTLNKEEEFKRILEEKIRKLTLTDKYFELSSSLEQSSTANDGSNESYIQQWTTKIIDNIEVMLSDVHFRYEDALSVPGKVVSAGVTLESFEISTCDDNWQPTAFSSKSNTTTPSSTAVNKLATIKSLGVYWQVDDKSSTSQLPLAEWEQAMQEAIYKINVGAAPPPQLRYILNPYKNSLFLRLTHNKKQTATLPRFDILAESSNLQLDIDSEQYRQLFAVTDRMASIERTTLPYAYCPKDRPTASRAAAVAWWRYAVKLALARPRYVRLVKLSRVAEEDPHLASLFTAKDAKAKRQYEERLPFNTLKLFRQIAILESTDIKRLKQQQNSGQGSPVKGANGSGISNDNLAGSLKSPVSPSPNSSNNSNRGWMGWLIGAGASQSYDEFDHDSDASSSESTPNHSPAGKQSGSNSNSGGSSSNGGGSSAVSTTRTDGETGDISIESIISTLNQREESQKVAAANAIYLRFSINSSSSIGLSCVAGPIARCNSTISFSFTQAAAGVSFVCELKDFSLADKFTPNPPIPNIISVKKVFDDRNYRHHRYSAASDSADKSTLFVHFERRSGKSKITISALPVELSINRVCISKLLSEFGRPENKYAVAQKKPPVKSPVSAFRSQLNNAADPVTSSGSKPKRLSVDKPARESISNMTYQSIVAAQTGGSVEADEDGSLEIVLEAYAPKIICPEDSTADRGYLLMDSGYLAVHGTFGSAGFTLSVSLKDINAGLPQSTHDMYTFGDKALYLIKVSCTLCFPAFTLLDSDHPLLYSAVRPDCERPEPGKNHSRHDRRCGDPPRTARRNRFGQAGSPAESPWRSLGYLRIAAQTAG